MKPVITYNPDTERVEEVRAALAKNDGYCPCRLEKTPENKCMCQEFKDQASGYCHCGLYVKGLQ